MIGYQKSTPLQTPPPPSSSRTRRQAEKEVSLEIDIGSGGTDMSSMRGGRRKRSRGFDGVGVGGLRGDIYLIFILRMKKAYIPTLYIHNYNPTKPPNPPHPPHFPSFLPPSPHSPPPLPRLGGKKKSIF